ncbi:hypothetical protein BDV29DRAFT_129443 [Aspergillus leporis]|uniref:Uncharacterized protein n=1 Tax=Aspergillus leporis TaxID=41062 RepID=A0A5N5XDE6_9EURO|nr:hypothetical protein BDV29DRAFT_129443 [Aspergillus leporis]
MSSSSTDTAQLPENGITIFEDDGADQLKKKVAENLELFLEADQQSSVQVIFTKPGTLERCASLELPDDFRRTLTADLNASFHTEYCFIGNDITGHLSWTLFKIKMVENPTKYDWIQASVFVHWDILANQQRVFFVDVPHDKQKQIQESFPSWDMRDRNPWIWHAVFGHAMKYLYDESIWRLRHVVRGVEKERLTSSDNDLPAYFKDLHDSGRHVVHLIETMEVAEHTMNSLVAEHARYRTEFSDEVINKKNLVDKNLHLRTAQKIAFIAKEVHSLKTRAKTLSDRLTSEIQLANNLVSHEMSRNTRYDSLVTKTLSFVGMIYLPGTFVSGIFGTNFFDFQSGETESWEMSREFWLYWAVTIPLTLATFAVWALWHYWAELRLNKSGKEKKKEQEGKDASKMA